MSTFRIVLVSNVRPSRTWRLAHRIARELPDAEICGIVQRSTPLLPVAEQNLAAYGPDYDPQHHSGANQWWNSLLTRIIDFALWSIHGFPRAVTQRRPFEMAILGKTFPEDKWPLLETNDVNSDRSLHFLRRQYSDLVIMLGDVALNSELLAVPRRGWIHARQENCIGKASEIRIEHLDRHSDVGFEIARVALPFQLQDHASVVAIKSDLVIDDLFVETAKYLETRSIPETSTAVAEWIQRVFSPLLIQLESQKSRDSANAGVNRRFRSFWKLCLDSLLLCSPLFVIRNWYRRLRKRYPLLILTHHLISDRQHRMAMSTEKFWRAVRFLQKHYRIMSLCEAVELLRSGKIELPTVVLTFDDGYADNFLNLRAVAEETGVPVTLFVTVEPVEIQRAFPHDSDEASRDVLPMTWEQIIYWSRRRAEFGSHTRTHLDCGTTDRSVLESEIQGSKADLEIKLQKRADFFAFPFGQRENMSSEAMELAGLTYRYFVSSFGGENLPQHFRNQRHLLRMILYADPWELELELQAVFDRIEVLKRRLHQWQTASLNSWKPLRWTASFFSQQNNRFHS